VNISYALDTSVWGLDPFGYHLTNLLLHCLNVALLFWLIAGIRGPGASSSGRGVAALAAALFAVHPMGTESVGYVASRSGLLCASFVLGSLLCFQAALACAPGARRRLWIAAGLAGFAFGLASKEVAVMLPVALVLYDVVFLPASDPRRRFRFVRLYAPLLALVAIGGWIRLHLYTTVEATAREHAVAENLLTQFGVVWRYLALFVAPLGQSVVHEVPEVQALGGPEALRGALAGLGLLLVALACWSLRRRQPLAAFGMLWFLAMLVPSSAIPLPELAAEHRTYLASAGLFLALAACLAQGLRALALPPDRAVAAAWVGALALLAALCALTVARNRVWSDPIQLWSDAATKAPGVFAPHYQLARALHEKGDCAAAVAHYERAVELVPHYLDARNNLGICLAQTGQLEEARRAFLETLARDPAYPRARNNLRTLAELEASAAAR
jgi:tetratricopeptide (TPR) repeat protein